MAQSNPRPHCPPPSHAMTWIGLEVFISACGAETLGEEVQRFRKSLVVWMSKSELAACFAEYRMKREAVVNRVR